MLSRSDKLQVGHSQQLWVVRNTLSRLNGPETVTRPSSIPVAVTPGSYSLGSPAWMPMASSSPTQHATLALHSLEPTMTAKLAIRTLISAMVMESLSVELLDMRMSHWLVLPCPSRRSADLIMRSNSVILTMT